MDERVIRTLEAPDVGAIFEWRGNTYRVNGWLKPMTAPATDKSNFGNLIDNILYQAQQETGPNKEKLVFCSRKDAVYVSGTGVCGVCAPIGDIKIVGRVNWSEDQINAERKVAILLIGEPVF